MHVPSGVASAFDLLHLNQRRSLVGAARQRAVLAGVFIFERFMYDLMAILSDSVDHGAAAASVAGHRGA